MSWEAAQAQLVTLLGTVAVTAPSARTIDRVYPEPPPKIENTPSFVIYPPAVRVQRFSGLRVDHYRIRCRLVVLDADLDVAAGFCNTFRTATLNVLDDNLTLNGTVVQIGDTDVEEARRLEYGGREFTMIDFFVAAEIKTPKEFQS